MKPLASIHAALLALLLGLPTAEAGGYGYGYYGHSYGYSYGHGYYGAPSYGSYGWTYTGSYYAPGAQWYGAGYWGGQWYPGGYWVYQPPVRVIEYVGTPVLYPVGVSSFNPAVAAVPDPMRPLASVGDPKAKAPGTCEQHLAAYKARTDARMEAMEKRLNGSSAPTAPHVQGLRSTGAQPKSPAATPPPTTPAEQLPQPVVEDESPLKTALAQVLVSAKASCMTCHASDVADTKGKAKGEANGFALTAKDGRFRVWLAKDGRLGTDFTADELVELNRRVPNLQDMPPKKAVQEGEVAAVGDRAMAAWVTVLGALKPVKQQQGPMPKAK